MADNVNVGFRRGLQSSLDNLIAAGTSANAADGVFYLTSDTNRLYIGKSDGSIAAVNEGVITVQSLGNLPTLSSTTDRKANSGRFYYVTDQNILCVFNGTDWVQINASQGISKVDHAVSVVSDTGTITTIVTDSNNAQHQGSFQITVDGGLSASSSGKTLTITGDILELNSTVSNNTATVAIDSTSGENDSEIKIIGGENVTIEKGTNDNEIKITSKDTKVTKTEGLANATSGFDVKITNNDNSSPTPAHIDPEIKYGENGDLSAKFLKGIATLPMYSKVEVDEKIAKELRLFNAMEYIGTVGQGGTYGLDLPTSAKNGWTFILTQTKNINGKDYPAGTLVIATGTEDSTGYIPANTVEWACVEAGVTDTTYKFEAIAGGVRLRASNNNITGTLTAEAGTDITINSSDTSGSGNTQKLTVAHKTYAPITGGTPDAAQPAIMDKVAQSYEIPVISSIETSNGHVTGYKIKTYTVNDTNAQLENVKYDINTSANQANITNTVTLKQANNSTSSKVGEFSIGSNNLTVTSSGAKVNIDMTWGVF